MEQGGVERQIIEAAAARGGRLPDKIANAPEILEGLAIYWYAFIDLTSCRHPGFNGPGPIPWDSINQWAIRYGLDDEEDFDRLAAIIQEMDSAYLKQVAKEIKRKSK